jgi:hypothetical protein
MSPEQGSGASNKIDGRSDVYSLGVMMFQLATGRLPFPGANFGEVLIGHLQTRPPQPRSLNPDVPEAYEAIILKCLEKKQEDRYASMKELKHALEACMDKLGISKDLPHADDSDAELPPVDATVPSFPGARRTPGRVTGPGSKQRVSNPNVRPPGSRPPQRTATPMGRVSQPPTQLTPAPRQGRSALYAGIAAVAIAAVGAGAFVVLRADRRPAAEPMPVRAAAAVKADDSPVFLSIVSEPLDAEVVATWKGGQKKGDAPLSLDVPRNAKVHFEFRKSGYIDTAMDVIADQPQTVQAQLKPAPAPVAAAAPEKRSRERKHRKDRPAQPSDGVVDVLGDLK